jgi:hypothetical protein
LREELISEIGALRFARHWWRCVGFFSCLVTAMDESAGWLARRTLPRRRRAGDVLATVYLGKRRGGNQAPEIKITPFPKSPHNILGSDLDTDQFLRFIVQNRHDTLSWQVERGHANLSISAFDRADAPVFQNALELFTKRLAQGSIDRRKLEVVCQKFLKDQQYADRIGKQLLLFRGRGGAGKTLRLLQIAKTLHDEFGHRVLFLTYNKSLVADVRRLLSILGISDKVDDRTIAIRSSDSFFFGLLAAYGLRPSQQSGNKFPVDYPRKKHELLDLLRLSNPVDILKEGTAVDNPDSFAWDFILVDEGQDWPQEERDILFALLVPNI